MPDLIIKESQVGSAAVISYGGRCYKRVGYTFGPETIDYPVLVDFDDCATCVHRLCVEDCVDGNAPMVFISGLADIGSPACSWTNFNSTPPWIVGPPAFGFPILPNWSTAGVGPVSTPPCGALISLSCTGKDWLVTLSGGTLDGTLIVKAPNITGDPPVSGWEFVSVPASLDVSGATVVGVLFNGSCCGGCKRNYSITTTLHLDFSGFANDVFFNGIQGNTIPPCDIPIQNTGSISTGWWYGSLCFCDFRVGFTAVHTVPYPYNLFISGSHAWILANLSAGVPAAAGWGNFVDGTLDFVPGLGWGGSAPRLGGNCPDGPFGSATAHFDVFPDDFVLYPSGIPGGLPGIFHSTIIIGS